MRTRSGIALIELMVASLIGVTLIVEVGYMQSNFGRWSVVLRDRAQAMNQVRLTRVFLARDWLSSKQLNRDGESAIFKSAAKVIRYTQQDNRLRRSDDTKDEPTQTISYGFYRFNESSSPGAALRIEWEWRHGKSVTRMETSIVPVK